MTLIQYKILYYYIKIFIFFEIFNCYSFKSIYNLTKSIQNLSFNLNIFKILYENIILKQNILEFDELNNNWEIKEYLEKVTIFFKLKTQNILI